MKSYVELIETTIAYIHTLISDRGEEGPLLGTACVEHASPSSPPCRDHQKGTTADIRPPQTPSTPSDNRSNGCAQEVDPSHSNEEQGMVCTDIAMPKPTAGVPALEKAAAQPHPPKNVTAPSKRPSHTLPKHLDYQRGSFLQEAKNSPVRRSDGEKEDLADEGIVCPDTQLNQASHVPALGKTSENRRKKGTPSHPSHTSPALSHGRLGAALRAVDPTLVIYAHPPSDEKAKRIKNAWNKNALISEISILFDKPHYDPFLNHVAKAISCRFAPAQLVEISSFEMKKTWDLFLRTPHLRLILCPKQLLFHSRELLKFYKEHSGTKKLFLGNVPLLLLSHPSFYKSNPHLKSPLWKSICQMLS